MITCVFRRPITFLLFALALCSSYAFAQDTPVLIGTIAIQPVTSPQNTTPGKIQPGGSATFTLKIRNSGTKANAEGRAYIRYQFPKPLDTQTNSLLYKSEEQPLPSIAAGKETTITFTTPQKFPSIFDFVRQDWGMRQYQAVVIIGGEEKIIGIETIALSAQYYGGTSLEIPQQVPQK